MNTITIASWLLTYLIHSTVLLGAAWLVARTLGERHLALQETLLRTALVGGIITSSLQVCLGVVPLGGAFVVDVFEAPQVTTVSTDLDGFAETANASEAASAPGLAMRKSTIHSWAGVLLTLWGAGSMFALLALGRSVLDLKRLLQTRRFRPAGRLVERLATAMGLRRRVLLSTSKAIAVPFATGVREPEICCPERVGDLAVEHQTGLFAHELAHLARRDPLWQLVYRLEEAILFGQPLNRLVRRRLEEIAEHLTDERAVACTGDRLGLARCLVVIAHWGTSSRLGVPATALASGPRLGRRVRRLLGSRAAEDKRPVWIVPIVVFFLTAAALTLPLVASVPANGEIAATKPVSVSEKTWSDAEEAPTETPAPPDRPSPPDERAPDPRPLAPALDAAPAPLTPPSPESGPSRRAPAAAPSKPAPASAPAPATAPSPRSEAAPPSPSAAPAPPREPDEPTGNQESKTTVEREREKAQQEAEIRKRSAKREKARAKARAQEGARQAEERAREHEERARQRTAEVEQRHRLTEERRAELRRQADETRAVAEARGREMERTSEERARAAEEWAQQLAEERAERAAVRRDEYRHQALEARRKAREDAHRLSEEARRLAEEAEKKARDEKPEKDD